MATNEQILERVDRFEHNVNDRFDKLDTRIKEVDKESKERDEKIEAKVTIHDNDLRGNGNLGIKAIVKHNTKKLAKIDKYFTAIILLIIGEFLARIFGLI